MTPAPAPDARAVSSAAAAKAGREAYRRAGVDVEAGARAVELIRDVARATTGQGLVEGVGGFAGLYRLDDRRLLAAATDGVGTKVEIARALGRLDTVGIDLVAMCANDVACTGAAPLFFLDYLAVGRVIPEEVAAIVSGVAEGCRRARCALLGGETAEHPGVMEAGRFDLAGFCVGLVEEERMLGPARVRAGDLLLGLPSSGLHANGYSLVRQVTAVEGAALGRVDPRLGRSLGEELLEPTLIYVDALLALAGAGLARSAAHITGGGILENLPRALPAGRGAVLDRAAWSVPPVFGVVSEAAGVREEELFGVLNMGIGMIVVTAPEHGDHARQVLREAGIEASTIGSVTEAPGVRVAGAPA